MPSLEESRKHVEASLKKKAEELNHDDILMSLQAQIDEHNAVKDNVRSTMRRSSRRHEDHSRENTKPSMRFRFKSETIEPEKRKNRSRHDGQDQYRRHHKRRRHESPMQSEDGQAAHPFPREPAISDGPDLDSKDAFRESLFDALADDEGAQYWEDVYSQPIHVYPRPSVETQNGQLEQMSDEEYAAYVKLKMWEKKNPHIVLERERAERQRKRQEEEQTRQREEFVRRKEQAAWERSQRRSARRHDISSEGEDFEYSFSGGKQYKREIRSHERRSSSAEHTTEYAEAWSQYLSAWDRLKHELLDERNRQRDAVLTPSKRIPWPVAPTKSIVKANIEKFLRNAPADDTRSTLQIYKTERVRWHPDKVQQRFGGKVDEGTMKLVTGVFQIVDGLFEEAKKEG